MASVYHWVEEGTATVIQKELPERQEGTSRVGVREAKQGECFKKEGLVRNCLKDKG